MPPLHNSRPFYTARARSSRVGLSLEQKGIIPSGIAQPPNWDFMQDGEQLNAGTLGEAGPPQGDTGPAASCHGLVKPAKSRTPPSSYQMGNAKEEAQQHKL